MNGYHIRLLLYSRTETWREIKIPKNINFKQLHNLIQKLFGFSDYHMWEFKVPFEIPDTDEVDLNKIIKTINYDEAETVSIAEIFNEYKVLLYEYDFGDSWEIIVYNFFECEYDYKTALIVDYVGKYNPIDDIGGIFVFDEMMGEIDDEENLGYVLDEYGLTKNDLSDMNFEKKYQKGSKIQIR